MMVLQAKKLIKIAAEKQINARFTAARFATVPYILRSKAAFYWLEFMVMVVISSVTVMVLWLSN